MGGNAFTSFPAAGGPVGGWVELGRTTLGSPASTIDVSSIADKRYYQVLINYAASIDSEMRFNGDSGNNYADRTSVNGGTDATNTSANKITVDGSASGTLARFINGYIANFDTKEKLGQFWTVKQQTAGAGTAPNRTETVGKHAQTTNPIDQMTVVNTGGNFPTGAELVVLGWDPADVHTTNFWEELASVQGTGSSSNLSTGTFTAKKYLWIQYYVESSSTVFAIDSFNNDTGNNYASRFSSDGGADMTETSQPAFTPANNDVNGHFTNMFIINNSANEKLCVIHTINQDTAGAGTAPARREMVTKWANTSSQITELDVNASTGNWGANSIIKVWGSN